MTQVWFPAPSPGSSQQPAPGSGRSDVLFWLPWAPAFMWAHKNKNKSSFKPSSMCTPSMLSFFFVHAPLSLCDPYDGTMSHVTPYLNKDKDGHTVLCMCPQFMGLWGGDGRWQTALKKFFFFKIKHSLRQTFLLPQCWDSLCVVSY